MIESAHVQDLKSASLFHSSNQDAQADSIPKRKQTHKKNNYSLQLPHLQFHGGGVLNPMEQVETDLEGMSVIEEKFTHI